MNGDNSITTNDIADLWIHEDTVHILKPYM